MRILGLIAVYAVGLFLISYIPRDVANFRLLAKSASTNFWECEINEVSESFLLDLENASSDSIGSRNLIQRWVIQPIGLVKYPNLPLLDFFDDGK
jgi:hypothetical protein